MDYLKLRDKLNLSLVSHRFLDIFSDFHFAKNLWWRVENYTDQDISSLVLLPSINYHRFVNVRIDHFDQYANKTALKLFSIIGQYTSNLRLKCFGSSKLLNCFPNLTVISMRDLDSCEFPPSITTIHLKTVSQIIRQNQFEQLEQLQNLKMLTAKHINTTTNIQTKSNAQSNILSSWQKFLYHFSQEFSDLSIDNLTVTKSLFNATIEPLDITFLDCSYEPSMKIDLNALLKKLTNLEKFICTLSNSEEVCFQMHDVKWPKLQSLTLNTWHRSGSNTYCRSCFNTILSNFSQLKALTLPEAMTCNRLVEIVQQFSHVTNFEIELSRDFHELIDMENFYQLKKLQVTGTMINKTALEIFPLLPNLEELTFIHLSLTPCYCGNDDRNCRACKNYTTIDWKQSPIFSLAHKCPGLKKLAFYDSYLYELDAFAAMNAWPEIESLQILTVFDCYDEDFLDFLLEKKTQGWKPPLLKDFLYKPIHDDDYKLSHEDISKLFEIFPLIKSDPFYKDCYGGSSRAREDE